MRHPSEILKELGFNDDAPESTKQAFLRHLQRAAAPEKSTSSSTETSFTAEQLSFEFSYQTEEVETAQLVLIPKTNLQRK